MDTTRRATLFRIGGATAVAACSGEVGKASVTAEEFSAWLARYGAAWSSRDAAAAGALFTEDASYHEAPFDAPMQGRTAIGDYWTRVTAAQSDILFQYDVIACQGEQGVAHWRAAFNADGALIELDGVFVCVLAADRAQVRSLREWWHVRSAPSAQ